MSSGIWQAAPPATELALGHLQTEAGVRLPADYLSFLAATNGGEGDLGIEPGWLQIWPADEVLAHNVGYQVSERLPGSFAFGTNGGGELLVFDTSGAEPFSVLMVPFIPMQVDHAIRIADSFAKLRAHFGVRFETTT
jgi:hypothetical protein